MYTANMEWVAGKILEGERARDFFQKLLREGEDEAKEFLVNVMNCRYISLIPSEMISFEDAARYYNLLDIPPVLFPQRYKE